jgi:hypothetical protein
MSTMRRTLVAAAATLAMGAAAADTVRITGLTYGYASIDTTLTGYVATGQMQGQHNGASFTTYCTDVFENVYLNTTYSDYFVAANGSTYGFTHQQADLLGRLYTVADNGTTSRVDTTNESVAFQLAVWELLYETSGSYNVTGGNFYAQGGGNSTQRSLANSWLASAASLVDSQFSVARLASVATPNSAGHQDLILVGAVPEPSSYVLMLAGLSAVGFVVRRRRG